MLIILFFKSKEILAKSFFKELKKIKGKYENFKNILFMKIN